MITKQQFSPTVQLLGKLAIISLGLLLIFTVTLVILRNSVENAIVQRAATDLPLLKNHWPQFKKSVEELHAPIAAMLAKNNTLEITPEIQNLMNTITSAHSYPLQGSFSQGYIKAHVEIVLFDKGQTLPTAWYWSPPIDTSLTSTEIYTRVSLQQLEQTQIITSSGLTAETTSPNVLNNESRARIFFFLHTEWKYYEIILRFLIRASQFLSFLTVLLISLWAYFYTNKITSAFLVIGSSILSLVTYSSLTLKALSMRTILSMIITLQFGAGANRSGDFAGLSLLSGAIYILLIIGLLNLPSRNTCPNCKRNAKESYRFCPFCNFALKRNCLHCSSPVDVGWNYCPSCSQEI
jgi:hypothetical protein